MLGNPDQQYTENMDVKGNPSQQCTENMDVKSPNQECVETWMLGNPTQPQCTKKKNNKK